MPRNLGMITERLPAAQYKDSDRVQQKESKKLQRNSSVSSRSEKIEEMVTELREKARLTSAVQASRAVVVTET